MAASVVSIWNRALQLVGAQMVVSTDQDSRNARACKKAWEMVRQGEFRAHNWSCLIKRVALAASTTAPTFNKAYAYPLPDKFLRLLPPDPESNSIDLDHQIEGSTIVTNESEPLYIRYIEDSEVVNQYDSLLREALAAALALAICEEITGSNSKIQNAQTLYENSIRKAKRNNAIETRPAISPDSEWLYRRN